VSWSVLSPPSRTGRLGRSFGFLRCTHGVGLFGPDSFGEPVSVGLRVATQSENRGRDSLCAPHATHRRHKCDRVRARQATEVKVGSRLHQETGRESCAWRREDGSDGAWVDRIEARRHDLCRVGVKEATHGSQTSYRTAAIGTRFCALAVISVGSIQ
jgi:hypothetical protein